jgi:hypothetical protein
MNGRSNATQIEKQEAESLPIQGPHCLLDFYLREGSYTIDPAKAVELVEELAAALCMKRYGGPRIIKDGSKRLSIYQIVSTSHIIIHFSEKTIHADLFSCEPFDLDVCVRRLLDWVGEDAVLQYCQRNLVKAPRDVASLSMRRLNRLTSNPLTFTHAMINWYGGDEKRLGDVRQGTAILDRAVACLVEQDDLPDSPIILLEVDPILGSWDKGGFSGGYVNLMRQLTMHTFRGVNGAYMDVMAHCFDLEAILRIVQEGFLFKFYEVDAVFQRSLSNASLSQQKGN